MGKYQEMKKRVAALDTSNEALKGKLVDSEAQRGQLVKEAKDMLMVQEELSRKMAENGKVYIRFIKCPFEPVREKRYKLAQIHFFWKIHFKRFNVI